jgi:hypothetical protein
MNTITSITAWRKALALGDTLRVVNHCYPDLNGIRTVTRVQGNAFATRATRASTGEVINESWFYYRKGNLMGLSTDGRTLHVYDDGIGSDDRTLSISYTVLEGVAAQ